MSATVTHNTELNRYEIWLDGEKVGHADYTRMPGEIHFVHTEVDPAHQGKQLAGILMQGAIDDVRANGKDKIVPVCSYTVMWMQRHPETHDLLLNSIEEAVAACQVRKREHHNNG
ncbi:MAG: GNAT family N-acetyltransferase [Microbacteriaceae bacterium]